MSSENYPLQDDDPAIFADPYQSGVNSGTVGRTTSLHAADLATYATEYDRRVAEETDDAIRVSQAAWDAMLSRVRRFDTLSFDHFTKLVGLPDTDARAIFRGMQARGEVSQSQDKNGSYSVLHPAEKKEDGSKMGSSIIRGLGSAAVVKRHFSETGANLKRMVGIKSRPGEVAPGYSDETRPVLPNSTALTRNPLDSPDYFAEGSSPVPQRIPIKRPRS